MCLSESINSNDYIDVSCSNIVENRYQMCLPFMGKGFIAFIDVNF